MGDFSLKLTHNKMKVLVLLACLGVCSAQYHLNTNRNLGNSFSAPSSLYDQPPNSYGAPVLQSFSATSNFGGSSRNAFSKNFNGESSYSSGGDSGFSSLGGNSGYSSSGDDVRRVSSIRFGNVGGSGFSSGHYGPSRSSGGNSGYTSGSFSGAGSNGIFHASNNQNNGFSSGSSGHVELAPCPPFCPDGVSDRSGSYH